MRGVVGKTRDEHNVAEAILAHTEGHNIYTAHCVCVRARARACVWPSLPVCVIPYAVELEDLFVMVKILPQSVQLLIRTKRLHCFQCLQ